MTSLRRFILVWMLLFAGTVGAAGMATRTLVVGSEQDYPPFAIGQTDDAADGFTVDLWKVIAQEAGLKYSIRVLPFHQLLEEFKNGKIDVLINLAQSEERRKFADFTVPHVVVHGAIFLRKGPSSIHGEQDLIGKSIIVLQGDITHDYAISQGWGNHLHLVATVADGLRLLASGQHDAMFVSKLVGMQTLQQLKLTSITALPGSVGAPQKYSFAVKKGDADLLALLNEGLALSKSSGAYDALYQKWFIVYEGHKEPTLRDILIYLLPLLAVFLGYVGLTYLRNKERQGVMRNLAESHHMLQTVIDTLPIRVFWKDRASQLIGCNTLFANDIGLANASEVIGKLGTQFASKGEATLYLNDDQQVMASGQSKLAYEEPFTTPDGRQLWVRTSKVPLRNLDQQIIGVLGVYQDITEAKETEQALMESERRLSEILENVSAYIYLKDSEGRYLFVNRLVRELWNASTEDIIGFGDDKFFDAATAANIRNNDRRVLQDGETLRTEETNVVAQSGVSATYWSVKLPLRRDNGEIYALCGISTDMSEVKQAQDDMRLATLVYESSSEAMMVTDAGGSIMAINPAFTKTTGYTSQEVMGQNPRILNAKMHDPS